MGHQGRFLDTPQPCPSPCTTPYVRRSARTDGQRPTRPAATLRGSGTVDRDPQAGLARGDGEICLRVRGFLADGVERGRTRSGRDGDVGSFAWPIRAGYPATHNPVRPRFCAERPRRPPRPAAALQGSGSAIVSRRPGGRGARSAAGFADSSGTGVKPVRTGE